MKKISALVVCSLLLFSCENKKPKKETTQKTSADSVNTESKTIPSKTMSIEEAEQLAALPLSCVEHKYPYKLGQTLGDPSELKTPQELHPIFYGCFDWHSAVHGYWSMVKLVSTFPELEQANEIKAILKRNISTENVAQELAYFEPKHNKSFERTYGWAWLLKLAETLHQWDDPLGKELEKTLQPLTDHIVNSYLDFLPKLVYPIRVGEHTNTAFGLTFAYDYAQTIGHQELESMIASRAKELYLNDKNCPLDWEPSGYDFLSPCLEEVDIMRRVLPEKDFMEWIQQFLPQLKDPNFTLEPGKVGDREDGKLVHLDGLNFSRAWVLYGLSQQYSKTFKHLNNVANQHIEYSYENLVGDSYEGGHWLGSFAIYALTTSK